MRNSIDQKLFNSRMAIFGAMNHPEIRKAMEKLGYDMKKMREGAGLLEEVQQFQSLKNQRYGDREGYSDSLKDDRDAAWSRYTRHVTYARLVFKGNKAIWKKLQLSGNRKRTLAGWVEQARLFYQEIKPVAGEMQKVSITAEELQQAWAMIEAVEQAYMQRKKEGAEAQLATKQRNEAMRKLDVWMKRFLKTVRIALDDKEQLLEVLGIVVKS